jgi:hypothetical protein
MFNFMTRSPLRDPDPIPAGGGASAAPAGGQPNPGAAPAFDAAAFKLDLMGEVNKTLNGFAKTFKGDLQKLIQPTATITDPDPDPTHVSPIDDAALAGMKPEAQIKLLRQQLEKRDKATADILKDFERRQKESETQLKAAANKEFELSRDNAISDALSGVRLANEKTAKDARKLFRDELQWSTDYKKFVGPDGVTAADEYIKSELKARPNWLAPVETSPAGARPSGVNGNGSREWQTEDIDRLWTLPLAEQKSLLDFIANTHAASQKR